MVMCSVYTWPWGCTSLIEGRKIHLTSSLTPGCNFLPLQLPSMAIDHILQLFDQSVDIGIDFLKQHSAELSCPVPSICAVKCLCCILGGLLRAIIEYHGGFAEVEEEASPNQYSEEESTSQLPHQTLAGIYIPKRRNVNPDVGSKVALSKTSLSSSKPVYQQKPGSLCGLIGNLFVFAYTWSFGGCFERVEEEVDLDIAGNDLSKELASEKIARGGNTAMEKFDALVYDLFSDGKITVQLPSSARLIYTYYPNIYTNTFEPLDRLISSPMHNVAFLSPIADSPSASRFMFKLFINPSEDVYSASSVSMIPTVDIVRLSFLISVMLESGSMPNIMVSGKSGVGKTQLLTFLSKSMTSGKWRKAVIQSMLGKPQQVEHKGSQTAEDEDLRKDTEEQSFSTIFYHISNQLQSQQMQTMLGSYLMRQGKSILIPPTGRNVCYNNYNFT